MSEIISSFIKTIINFNILIIDLGICQIMHLNMYNTKKKH